MASNRSRSTDLWGNLRGPVLVLTYLSATLSYLRTRLGGQRVGEAGVTAVEYALMVAIIALLMVGGFYVLFNAVQAKYNDVGDCIRTEPAPADCAGVEPPATTVP
jgi:Flp pilus assembly pilin Flp